MGDNPFRSMVRDWHQVSIASVVRKSGLAPGTVEKIVNSMDKIPPNVTLKTLYTLAECFGYRVRVTLEKKNES